MNEHYVKLSLVFFYILLHINSCFIHHSWIQHWRLTSYRWMGRRIYRLKQQQQNNSVFCFISSHSSKRHCNSSNLSSFQTWNLYLSHKGSAASSWRVKIIAILVLLKKTCSIFGSTSFVEHPSFYWFLYKFSILIILLTNGKRCNWKTFTLFDYS